MNDDNQKQEKFLNKKILKYFTIKSIIGTVTGAIGGYIYYFSVGCKSGSCSLQSNPWLMVLWGAAMGFLIVDLFTKPSKNKDSA